MLQSILFVAALTGLWAGADTAIAIEYPCPSDPGFCYRDFGGDGCFDVATDEGPINDEIEASATSSPVPTVGSIVCPPSVEKLSALDAYPGPALGLATEPPYSILFYAADIDAGYDFTLRSGGDLLLGGRISAGLPENGNSYSELEAQGDVLIEGGVKLRQAANTPFNPWRYNLAIESASGDVIVAEKATLQASELIVDAPAGNFVLNENARIKTNGTGDIDVHVGGMVELRRAAIKVTARQPTLRFRGSEIRIHESLSVKAADLDYENVLLLMEADPGDVLMDGAKFKVNGRIQIAGTSVEIGRPVGGRLASSLLSADLSVTILATGPVRLERVRGLTPELVIETQGVAVDLLDDKIAGRGEPTQVEITAGPGSTCDLTGTTVIGTLTTSCDTVVGP